MQDALKFLAELGWSKDINVCEWQGIQCIGDAVSAINLDARGITATIPSEFGQLISLTSLILSNNMFGGAVPAEVARLPLLQSINLNQNAFVGALPSFQSTMTSIELQSNRFSGTIPDDYFAALSNLVLFDVSGNNLSGTIPSSISSATSLSTLDLSSNSFVGTMPPGLGALKYLQYLYISSNRFVGTIPRSFASVDSSLVQVWMQQNDLSGTIPATFAEMKYLDDFYVDGNLFTGTIPADLCRPTLNAEFFQDVYSGNLQDNGTLPPKTGTNYWCERIACPADTYSTEGVMPCQPCENGTTTPFIGQHLECYTTNQDEIIRKLYESTQGDKWSRGDTWFYKDFDTCEFTGIRCNKAGHIVSIELPTMNLRGTIPYELGFLDHLATLDLSDNYLTGFIPATLANPPLKKLSLGGNELQGPIPPAVCIMPVNGNGADGSSDCDAIACAAGTYSVTGTGLTDSECIPCAADTSGIVGRQQCLNQYGQEMSAPASQSSSSLSGGAIFGIIIAVIAGVVILLALVAYLRKKKGKVAERSGGLKEDSFSVEDTTALRQSHGRYSDNPEFCDVPVLEFPKLNTPETPNVI